MDGMTLTVEKALETVLAHTPTLPAEDAPLESALGRVLAEDVTADRDFPPFDRAAMDGYAVRVDDVAGAPVVLEVAAQVRAGQSPDRPLAPGQAVQIMTGAPVPAGAGAVVPVEKARALPGGRRVELLAAVLAAVGKGRVRVGRRPTVSVLATGDELVDVWDTPQGARIRNSNGYAVAAQARWAGAEVRSLGTVPDHPERIADAVRAGFASDVLLVSGGVSAGAYDLVEDVLERFDVGLLFTRVAVKPGAPLVFGRRGDRLVFGLPGNPVSAQVTFDLFVRPALLRMQGARVVARPALRVTLKEAVQNRSGRRSYTPARVVQESDALVAWPIGSQGSGDLVAHARANALVALDPERTRAEAGEIVDAVPLGNFLERAGG
jgi:molybdopterin molybdotransferase